MRAGSKTLGMLALVVLIGPTALADIALLGDGTRVPGQLTQIEGRLRFLKSGKPVASQLQLIQFTPVVFEHFHRSRQRIWLHDAQHISGSLVNMGPQDVVLQVATKDARTIPRVEVRALSSAAPFGTVFSDDFEEASKSWQLAGGAARSKDQAASGEWALKLARPGQSAIRRLPERVKAGRIDLVFRLDGTPANAVWQLRAVFGEGDAEKGVTVLLAGAAEPGEGLAEAVPTTDGWHRLSLRFHASYVLVGLDRQVAWSSQDRQRFGPLRSLALVCVGSGDATGAVFIDDVSVGRSATTFRPTAGTVDTDVLRLPSGDQVFGTLAGADGKTLDFRGKFKTSPFSWDEVAGVELRTETMPVHRTVGEHVRVRFFGADASEPDELLGVVTALDGTALTLEHAVLGKVVIERPRLVSLRPLFHGVRLDLGHEVRHLGAVGTKVPGVRAAAAGNSLKKSFKVEAAPRDVTLTLAAAFPGAESDSVRMDVLLNGAKVEALERHLRRASAEYRHVSIVLPADAVRVGDNVLELRLSPASEGGPVENCLVRDLLLELSK